MNPKFQSLWLQHTSWAPIILTPDGWVTLKGRKGGSIPLGSNHLQRAYDQYGEIIGKRFGQMTSYLMLDVDRGSRYHPLNGSVGPILEALAGIGLAEHIKIRSSASLGLHLYFPLAKPVKCWWLAKQVHGALTAAGIEIANGTLELFPNQKPYEPDPAKRTEYQGHRLPLQPGSFILDDEWAPVSQGQAKFVERWEATTGRNMIHQMNTAPDESKPSKKLPPLPEFTGPCQTNSILAKLANYGSRFFDLTTLPALTAWMEETVVKLTGYDQWCSEASQFDIKRGWCQRWAKSHLKSRRGYSAKKQGPNHNQAVAADALTRLRACMAELAGRTFDGINTLFQHLREKGKELHGCGIGWATFLKLRSVWQHLTQSSVGGTGPLEAPPPTNPKPRQTTHTVINWEGVCTQSGQESQELHPPTTEAVSEAPKGVAEDSAIGQETNQELKAGDRVKVWLPGCPSHGVETVIKSKQWDACGRRVYRLGVRLVGRCMELPAECLRINYW